MKTVIWLILGVLLASFTIVFAVSTVIGIIQERRARKDEEKSNSLHDDCKPYSGNDD